MKYSNIYHSLLKTKLTTLFHQSFNILKPHLPHYIQRSSFTLSITTHKSFYADIKINHVFNKKTKHIVIRISLHLHNLFNTNEILDTIAHELAHCTELKHNSKHTNLTQKYLQLISQKLLTIS